MTRPAQPLHHIRVALRAISAAVALLLLGACSPVVMPAGPPTSTPNLRDDVILARDGVTLPLRRFLPDQDTRAVILALHGFNDHAGNFLLDSLPAFRSGGLLIYAYDQRGFGQAPNRGYWAGAETLADDAAEAARLLRRRYPDRPIFILGESMGAAVAILAATSAQPPPVDGYILTTPALWSRDAMPLLMRGGLWLAARTIPMLGIQGGVSGVVASDNPAALQRLGRDPLAIRSTRVDAAVGLVDLMDSAVAALPRCCNHANGTRQPTLMLVGAQDMIVPARATREALRNLPPEARPRIAVYPQGFHLLLAGGNRDVVARDILAFIAAPDGALPSGAEANLQPWLDGSLTPGS